MNRSFAAVIVAGALALGTTLTAAPALAATAAAAPSGATYYSLPFTDDLYRVAGDAEPMTASYAEWQADGFPSPVRAPFTTLKYTWAPTIFADVALPGQTITLELDYAGWRAAGFPSPRTDVLASGTFIFKYASSDELFASTVRWQTDTAAIHKLTYGEWTRLGSPAADLEPDVSYEKLSWLSTIIGPDYQTGERGFVDYDEWVYLDRPTPRVVASFRGDRYCQAAGSADIVYRGDAAPQGLKMSYAQWVTAGKPAPTRC
ncbi:hypothetical protein [Clavibacter capsici]|uniref:Secreted protein n=1 Tax=Clavibacter capsici TaxID=1874630 RepID=A0AAE6XPX4_9MICO|nr:hypothetical protein [Clavibacter capsici]ALD12761.1 hypothetical protein AES38_07415 [Clavibacter capsici]QIS44927.1 hypothetical protein GW570_07440 [Clavibacter capsici]